MFPCLNVYEVLEILLVHQIAAKPGNLAMKIRASLTWITWGFASNYWNSAFGKLAFDAHTHAHTYGRSSRVTGSTVSSSFSQVFFLKDQVSNNRPK